MKHYILL